MKSQEKISNFPIIIENDEHGYYATCPLIQGAYTCAGTYEEVLKSIKEVIMLCLEDELVKERDFNSTTVSLLTMPISVA